MKKYIISLLGITLFVAACSKEKQCIKGKIIGIGHCNTMWAVQIIDGPKIGEQWKEYDNVIELYNAPNDKRLRDTIYFTMRNSKSSDYKTCNTFREEDNYSSVEKALLSYDTVACP